MSESLRDGYLPQQTITYITYIKTALVEGLSDVFDHHIDPGLQAKVGLDFPKVEADYPKVIVRFYERDIVNAGVGHLEYIDLTSIEGLTGTYKFKHSFYHGDIELAILALSSLDQALMRDTVVQIVKMGELQAYTNRFFQRIYPEDSEAYPDSVWHSININTDDISGFGESQMQTPWGSEDDLVYKASYRVPVFGEFYSPPPEIGHEFISKVNVYPYIGGQEPVPEGDPDNEGWVQADRAPFLP